MGNYAYIQVLVLILLTGCRTENRNLSRESNEKAVDYYFTALGDKTKVDNCLFYVSDAVRHDSSNKIAFWNKFIFEFSFGRVNSSKRTALLYFNSFNDPSALIELGKIYQFEGDSIQSKKYFEKALDVYQQLVQSKKISEDSVLFELSIANYLAGNKMESETFFSRYRSSPKGSRFLANVSYDSLVKILRITPPSSTPAKVE